MKITCAIASGVIVALTQAPAQAGDTDLFQRWSTDTQYLQLAYDDDRHDRREERGRSDERDDRQDCRQEEGVVGQDKRECKQEEVRDGVRGNQGDRGRKHDD